MLFGNMPRDGGAFILERAEKEKLLLEFPELEKFVRPFFGSEELINGKMRWCFWIEDQDVDFARQHPELQRVMSSVAQFRKDSKAPSTQEFANRPNRFVQIAGVAKNTSILVAKVSSERRPYLPASIYEANAIASVPHLT